VTLPTFFYVARGMCLSCIELDLKSHCEIIVIQQNIRRQMSNGAFTVFDDQEQD
jgi:hypothetical protein